ncbi:GTPase ObgE [bacterium]|nr:GTPase ObgE [bacterium]
MDFIDEVTFWAHGGNGGHGCMSFRREKFVPKGGPDGGDGGHGGDVILRVDPAYTTLFDYRHKKHYRAKGGGNGKGKKMSGRNGETIELPVPPGTLVKDGETGELIVDLTRKGQTAVVAKGGRGGKGNVHFKTSSIQAPEKSTAGTEGERRFIRLELKLLADVGLVGLPNAGKSTLLSRISAARPKIADYPFTTLVPNLGIVKGPGGRTFVAADIPGLIEGAHAGKGLGDRFLRHIERTAVLLFLVDAASDDPGGDYRLLLRELKEFDPAVADKPRLVALSKIDLIPPGDRKTLPKKIGGQGVLRFSCVTGEGLSELVEAAAGLLSGARL